MGRQIYIQQIGRYIVGVYKMSLESKVSVARPNSKSLRATVPEGIVAFLNLKAGDKLDWKMDIDDDGKRIVVVHKAGE